MSNAFDKASLVMLPHAYEEGKLYSLKPTDRSGDFTFSRGTDTATRVNASGNIEKETGNLLLQSNQFLTGWTNYLSNETSGQVGYDGSNDAWLLTKTGVSGHIAQAVSQSGVNTFSVYVKAGTLNWVRLIEIGGGNRERYFDLQNGVLGGSSYTSEIDSKIQSIGNGWYRCSITTNISFTQVRIYPAQGDFDTTGTSGTIYIQDAQLEQGLVARDYIQTTTAPVYGGLTDDMPRLDYSGGATCPSLLLEPSRSNLLAQSEYLNASIIARSNDFIINTSDTTSPEGLNNACKFEFIPGAARYFGRNVGTLNDATTSVFVKAGSHQYIQYVTSTSSFTVNFDVANGTSNVVGTLPSGATYDIEDYGNGWYRIWVSHDHLGTVPSVYWWVANDLNTPRAQAAISAGDMYFYGFQVEAGSYPTSYIPTYGSSQTRAADTCRDAYTNSTGEYFSVFLDYSDFRSGGINGDDSINFKDSSGSTIFSLWGLGNGFVIRSFSGDSNGGYYTNYQFGKTAKALVRYDGSNINLFIDGVKVTNLSPTETNWNQIAKVHTLWASDNKYRMNQFIIFDSALSDSECIALTTV